MQTYRFGLAVSILTLSAFAQTPTAAPALNALPRNFYHDYELIPIGNGDKLLLTLHAGGQKVDLVVEPVAPKDGAPVTQYVLYQNGGIVLYSKTTITLPAVDGGDGTPVEGLSVVNVPTGPATPAPAPTSAPAPQPVRTAHQASSEWTTLPKNNDAFVMPIRRDRTGFGLGIVRIWLLWDGKNEIQVDPTDSKLDDRMFSIMGFGSHVKYLSNVYSAGAHAPRYFYLRRNKDDSITIFGNDDMAKLKAIEKTKK